MNKKYKILTVDDEPVNLKLLEAHLLPRGYEVLQAQNGLRALEILNREPIDIVLLDVMMPIMNGFEVLKKIRADEKLRLTPVILVTALKAIEDRVTGIEAGCDDFISKPFDKAELLARIQSLLKISYYRQQLDLKERFEKVVNNINEGVVICSPLWKIKEINAAAKILLSLGIPDQTEKDILDIIFDKCSVSLSRDIISNTKSPVHQFELMRPETKQTTPLYLEANLDLLHTPEGQLSNIVLRLHDKTEEKNQYLLKQDFMSFMTHKLFNPLTPLMGQVELISSDHYGKLSGDQKKAFEQIYELSKKIKNRVTKLLNFVNYQKNYHHLFVQEDILNLDRYLSEFVHQYIKEHGNHKKVEVKVNYKNYGKAHFMNKDFLNIIFGNLLDNALKFNDKDMCKIVIDIEDHNHDLILKITDNGQGIPAEKINDIFKSFYQAEKYFTGNVEGVGLGLPIIKSLTEACGGKVEVYSELGKGSTFTLTLPVSSHTMQKAA